MKKYKVSIIYWQDVRVDGFVDYMKSVQNHTVTRYANGLKEAREMTPAKVSWNHNMKAFWGYNGATECIIKEA